MSLLNDNLKCRLVVHLYGQALSKVTLINSLPVELLSSLSFILKKNAFTLNEELIEEQEQGDAIYHIIEGKVALIHKETKTFITDLGEDESFGEISFFTS